MEKKKISFGFIKTKNKTPNLSANNYDTRGKVNNLIKEFVSKEAPFVDRSDSLSLIIPLQRNGIISNTLKEGNGDTNKHRPGTEYHGLDSVEVQEVKEFLSPQNLISRDSGFLVPRLKPDQFPDGAVESTLHDYDTIPVAQYGLAILRGMGWVEPLHKITEIVPRDHTLISRPKGMGLGADKYIQQRPLLIVPEPDEKLVIKKHAYVRILGGKHKDSYGKIEGFDDGQNRVIVKMTIGGSKISFNEFLCQPVSRKEFAEYGKCINCTQFEQYKRSEVKSENITCKVEDYKCSSLPVENNFVPWLQHSERKYTHLSNNLQKIKKPNRPS